MSALRRILSLINRIFRSRKRKEMKKRRVMVLPYLLLLLFLFFVLFTRLLYSVLIDSLLFRLKCQISHIWFFRKKGKRKTPVDLRCYSYWDCIDCLHTAKYSFKKNKGNKNRSKGEVHFFYLNYQYVSI